MKKLFYFLAGICISAIVTAQTPVPMASQPGFIYTEDFSDIANWADGFIAGVGANRFGPVAILTTGTVPSPAKTTVSTATFSTDVNGGVQRGSSGIILLSTGTTDNTTAAAIDFFMDFTGVNAGTLSFDWSVVFNSSGNRKGSLRVYASTDGTTFSELTAAAVLNFTNFVAGSGSITNVTLPAGFSGNPNARLRFYYHNGAGGTTGSRPKINIDNLKVTATGSPCVAPAAQPTALTFSNITDVSLDGSFTAASPAADEYLVVMSNNSSLTGDPTDGTIYNAGDGLGDGTVIYRGSATAFTATGLSASTHYHFFVYSIKNLCSGGPSYLTVSPLINDVSTIASLPNCVAPAGQATALNLTAISANAIQGSFTPTTANEYLVVRSTAVLNTTPVNGQTYTIGGTIGNGIVVQSSTNTTFTAAALAPSTNYNFYIFSFNSQSCLNGPAYNTVSPLTGSKSTLPLPVCTTPAAQPASVSLTATNNSVLVSFAATASADNYLTVRSTSPTLSATPVDGVNYTVGNTLGGGTVVYNSNGSGFVSAGLTQGTTYYYFIFAANENCSGGSKYLTPSPLTGNATTTVGISNNYYYGNWHAHSDYSDGNKDNPGYTPGDDYLYAMNSLCLDYLGISEHNHFTSNNNPGNKVANYHLGSAQANSFTSTHANFVGMYGMEWGVISNGGHVIVYGDGMDELFGWETGSGGWGAANNYDVFVQKSDYTGANGLFKTINDRAAQNTFATLAHPNSSDFGNIANSTYNAVADNAVVGVAVESGPAFSTTTAYDEPDAMSLSYFQTMLSRGYHLGPVIDHDNHNTNFGRTARTRTAIIAPALTKTELIKAMRNMHFYATEDCDIKVDFSINTRITGTVFTDRFAPNISVTLTDATTSVAGAVINLMYGAPGSGILPAKIYSATGSSLSFTDNTLANLATGYYYLDITNAGSRIVTAPIWYTRTDNVVPVKLSQFFATKEGDRVKLTWNTEQEINSASFTVEHSVDGQHWTSVTTIAAAVNSNIHRDYLAYHISPVNGINYYRLKQTDKDGRYEYSIVRSVMFSEAFMVTVAPNPARDVINVYCKNDSRTVYIQLTDAAGRTVKSFSSSQSTNNISTTGIAKGLYFLKVMDKGETNVIKVYIQ